MPRATMMCGQDLSHGDWMGEPVLWTHWMHRGILSAGADSRLCLLDAYKFQATVSAFDHEEFNPKVYAAGYVESLNQSKEQLSDVTRGMETHAMEKLQSYIFQIGKARLKANTKAGMRQ